MLYFLLGTGFGAVVMFHIYVILLRKNFTHQGERTYLDRDRTPYKKIHLENRVIIIYETTDFENKRHDL